MQRFFVFLFCWLLLLSGPFSAWVDCFQHSHESVEDHHSGVLDSIRHAGDEHDHFPLRLNCSRLGFDLESLPSSFHKPALKLWDREYRLAFHGNLSAEQASVSARGAFTQDKLGFTQYPLLVGLSPHLFFSVFRI
jgi:hypothetical protein